jgi:hypothetical protein
MLDRVTKDMVVLDRQGERLGTVAEIYQPAGVAAEQVAVGPETAEAATAGFGRRGADSDAYLRVNRGTLEHQHLFVPAIFITDVTPDSVVVNAERDRLDELGWERRPAFIPED